MGLITMDLFRQLLFLGQAHGFHLADRRSNVFGGDSVHAVALFALLKFQGKIESTCATERGCHGEIGNLRVTLSGDPHFRTPPALTVFPRSPRLNWAAARTADFADLLHPPP
jgi:hypothetical protein